MVAVVTPVVTPCKVSLQFHYAQTAFIRDIGRIHTAAKFSSQANVRLDTKDFDMQLSSEVKEGQSFANEAKYMAAIDVFTVHG